MSSRFILHGTTRDKPRRQCGSLMALGGSVKQTTTRSARLTRTVLPARRQFPAVRQSAQALRCSEQARVRVPLKLPPALRTNALQARKGVTMSPSNPNTLRKLTGVRGSDILFVSGYTTKEH